MIKGLTNLIAASLTALALLMGAAGTPAPVAPTPDPVPTPPPAPVYDWSQPVPEGDLMGEDWFDDSAILGHSLMEGFEAFSGVHSNIHYFTSTGISAGGALTYKKFNLPDGGTGTLREGLDQRQFSKLYIMLGVNEITISSDRFQKNMSALVDLIRESQGEDIPIYIINITPTTRKKSDASSFNLNNITRLNAALQTLCEERACYYLDLYSRFADEDGYLPSSISTDGVHVTASQYKVMADYLKSHTGPLPAQDPPAGAAPSEPGAPALARTFHPVTGLGLPTPLL